MPTPFQIMNARKAMSKPAEKKPAGSKGLSFLQARQKLASTEEGRASQYPEVERICDLPITQPMTEAEQEAFNQKNVMASVLDSGFRLFPVQAEAVHAYETVRGVFGPVAVGFGKTLISLMVANKAFTRRENPAKRVMLLVPSQVLIQLVQTDIKWARSRVAINYPIHVLGGKSIDQRRMIARSGKKGLYVMPYSLLSAKDAPEALDSIMPELVICDEAHNVANRRAARTRRLMKYIEDHKPDGVCLSGTITSKSIHDYYHLIRWCLGEGNPLPNSGAMADEWAQILDADSPENSPYGGPLLPLIQWAQKNFPQDQYMKNVAGFRKAFRQRLDTTAGVVSSGSASIGTSLVFHNEPVKNYKQADGYERLKELIDQVTEMWLTPNGDEIEHAIHTWKWLNELSAGFYNQLTWPEPDALAKRKQVKEEEAEDLIERSKLQFEANQAYAKELRPWLEKEAPAGLDTPFLVGQSMYMHGGKSVPSKLYEAWKVQHDMKFEGMIDRDSTAIRVSPYKIDAAVEWAQTLPKGTGALVWVYHQEIGRWAYEAMLKAGVEAVYCPAGHNKQIAIEENASKIVVASITSHGTGKNLQHFQHQYILQWPRQAKMAEQLLGRTHRNGQKADELIVETNRTLEFDRLNFAACVNDALYIQQTTGNRQKLIYGTYNPIPKIFPSAALRERGFQNEMLTKEQQAILEEKFEFFGKGDFE